MKIPELQTMTYVSLELGSEFRTSKLQRKNYKVLKIFDYTKIETNCEPLKNKVMVIVQGCKQIVLEPNDVIFPPK